MYRKSGRARERGGESKRERVGEKVEEWGMSRFGLCVSRALRRNTAALAQKAGLSLQLAASGFYFRRRSAHLVRTAQCSRPAERTYVPSIKNLHLLHIDVRTKVPA
jgi:hypothetical protein